MINVTELAAQEVQKITESEGKYLRIGVMGGGCSGFRYSLELVKEKTDTDEVFPQHGITVICDSKSHLYLDGTTIDFNDEPMGRGFVFNNPNATNCCGCGDSFSA